jgi:argininosuccinate lyase
MAAAVVAGACLKAERAAAAADESWASATELADALVRKGLPFHQAHRIVGRLVLESARTGRRPGDWTGEELAAFDPAFDPEMAAVLPAARAVENHDVEGGTAPARVADALAAARRRLDELRSRLP